MARLKETSRWNVTREWVVELLSSCAKWKLVARRKAFFAQYRSKLFKTCHKSTHQSYKIVSSFSKSTWNWRLFEVGNSRSRLQPSTTRYQNIPRRKQEDTLLPPHQQRPRTAAHRTASTASHHVHTGATPCSRGFVCQESLPGYLRTGGASQRDGTERSKNTGKVGGV